MPPAAIKVPNSGAAIVPKRKITLYLLNPAHPTGGSKASFFLRFGFTIEEWLRLADALTRHLQENPITFTERTLHGTRYVIDGLLAAPDGSLLNVRAAWFIDRDSSTPRFITAHPLPRKYERHR